MLDAPPESRQQRAWKDLYIVALRESDKNRIPSLIAEAEDAIKMRARALFYSAGDHVEEEEAMNDALYALYALKNCLALHSGFADARNASKDSAHSAWSLALRMPSG